MRSPWKQAAASWDVSGFRWIEVALLISPYPPPLQKEAKLSLYIVEHYVGNLTVTLLPTSQMKSVCVCVRK